uniref:Methyltransferase FkbM domain-containing protein n=1 Tax=Skeletonema marinoi TaxID=267567 RepID=A0A7S2PPM3_9STRA|mmetsp:Transcript_27720/g.46905  ORF Transcript_27720/g.46905 Transcript_27720/m.46905 type:complete len:293 (+) Transcript_27720:186-1064(+)
MSDNKRRTLIASVAVLSTLLMLHQLRNQDPTLAHTISETSKSSASQLLNNTAPAWKTAARACERPVILEEGWYKSQSREDRALEKWFKDICHGTYMEIGGLDGVTFSNTYVYNKGLNWSGVLVEASPMNYQQLVRNRPNEIANVHAGVCEKEMDLHWVQSGPAVGGFQEFAHPDFQKMWWSEDDIKNAQVIKCHTLEQILLDKVGPGFYFDFFSLDVEGAELSVLRSINFDLVGFGVILMEADEHNPTKNMAARELLESNGYMYLEKKGRSFWFVNQDFGAIYKDLIHPGSE